MQKGRRDFKETQGKNIVKEKAKIPKKKKNK